MAKSKNRKPTTGVEMEKMEKEVVTSSIDVGMDMDMDMFGGHMISETGTSTELQGNVAVEGIHYDEPVTKKEPENNEITENDTAVEVEKIENELFISTTENFRVALVDPELNIMDVLNLVSVSANLDLRMYGCEILDYIKSVSNKNAVSYNNANRCLNNLIIRFISSSDYDLFKVKFDLINKLFKDHDAFEPIVMMQFSGWTKSDNEINNFSQIITIIEELANPVTRKDNKVKIANLSNLRLPEIAIANIKKYYKI